MKKTFAAAITCVDGRTQIPVIEYLMHMYAVDFVDMITEPGVNRVLAEDKDEAVITSLKKKLEISVIRHGSRIVAIAGHDDCAGNPTDKETQISHILAAKKVVRSWNLGIQIIGLWLDENWNVHEIQ